MNIEVLRECFDLQEDGTLIWKYRPLRHFKTAREQAICNTRLAGKKAGSDTGHGYLKVQGKYVHRIVYALYHGVDPGSFLIDHIDCNGQNNHPSNLRLATKATNGANRSKLEKRNKSGVTGVHFCKRLRKWWAQGKVSGKTTYFGTYTRFEDAVAAATEARRKEYGDFAKGPEQYR